MTRLTLRVDFAPEVRLGPGKVRLLELINEHGSISAAGRAMGMSYRRAWLLVDDLNRCFKEPLVVTQMGGIGGGGATLTRLGEAVLRSYRAMETAVEAAAAQYRQALEASLSEHRGDSCSAASKPSRRPCE